VVEILSGVVEGASGDVNDRITGALTDSGAQVSPERVAALAEPVRAEIIDSQPLGENSGRGPHALLPDVHRVPARLHRGKRHPGQRGDPAGRGPSRGPAAPHLDGDVRRQGRPKPRPRFVARGVPGPGGLRHLRAAPRGRRLGAVPVSLALAAASLFVALLLFIISLGLATSGGTTPVQNLPEILRAVADVLPFKHATDGVRALLF
jgi:hypothetical protein